MNIKYRLTVALLCWALVIILAPEARAQKTVRIAELKHPVQTDVEGSFLPYVSNRPLSQKMPGVTRLMVAIHSSSYDAYQYLENSALAASRVRGAASQTLIVVPHLFDKKELPTSPPPGMIYWQGFPFWGSRKAAVGPKLQKINLSAYTILDDWLKTLSTSEVMPNLKDIVIVGHSAGGQMVQRYAVVGKFEPRNHITIRYVVCAPSSYAYPTNERPTGLKPLRFAKPTDAQSAKCPGYNEWGYGLEKPYAYSKDVDTDAIFKRYATRHVFYICGANDNDPNHASLSRKCGAMVQGQTRLERMQIFFAYLQHAYGNPINQTHAMAIAPKTGHSGKGNMTSKEGLRMLFETIGK